MALSIKSVAVNSIAAINGLQKGDKILAINGKVVNDFLDLQFYTADDRLRIDILDCKGDSKTVYIDGFRDDKLGIEPEAYSIRKCSNNCIFCFIDQMPPKLRQQLYVKDDDYIYSFIFGNYISLNNIDEKALQRIIDQRLSPLYISVHTTDNSLRARIMGYKNDFNIKDRLQTLSDSGISFHTQIVLMPGINDGEELEKTIDVLSSSKLNTLSIGIVPVGLTKYREDLYPLTPYTAKQAKTVLNTIERYRQNNTEGNRIRDNIYPADELILLAKQKIPEARYYKDFCQIENGIGMVRATMDNFSRNLVKFVKELAGESALFITGQLSFGLMTGFINRINRKINQPKASAVAIKNNFFGDMITVSGLLTFRDIKQHLKSIRPLPEVLVLSSNMFNADGLTLDNVHYNDFGREFNRKILIIDELWNRWHRA